MYGRPSNYKQYSEPVTVPVVEGVSPEVARAIPFPIPPRPIEYMPIRSCPKQGFSLDGSLRPEQLRVEIESCVNALKAPFHRLLRAIRSHVSLCCRLWTACITFKNATADFGQGMLISGIAYMLTRLKGPPLECVLSPVARGVEDFST
jgi:hypothetical protein